MISKIRGTLEETPDGRALVADGGLSYDVLVPNGLEPKLRELIGQEVTFHTIHYLEGGLGTAPLVPRLIGFLEKVDREFFELFTTVKGIGPRRALKSLTVPINAIALAIENRDHRTLASLPGVGARTAERIVAELNGKMAKFALIREAEPLSPKRKAETPFRETALAMLSQLQYSELEARRMIDEALESDEPISSAEELVRAILKSRYSA